MYHIKYELAMTMKDIVIIHQRNSLLVIPLALNIYNI